ncbi:hypothetical protein MXB_4226 [Myxobolus squamalis]|nr:hypothetical protein MXB_4226 [Myxobolus squamalis]
MSVIFVSQREGLLPAYENFLRLNRELIHLQENRSDQSLNIDEVAISRIKEEQLCAKVETQVCDPALMELGLEYSCAVCIYLLNAIGLDLSNPIDFDISSFQPVLTFF